MNKKLRSLIISVIFSVFIFLILFFRRRHCFFWLEQYAFIPLGILFAMTMFWALKVEKIKNENDIQTYKEIVEFCEGKKLDELHKAIEAGKRPYQNILKVCISAVVTGMVCFLIGFMLNIFLNKKKNWVSVLFICWLPKQFSSCH